MIKKYLTYIKEDHNPFKDTKDYSIDTIRLEPIVQYDVQDIIDEKGYSQALKTIKNNLVGRCVHAGVYIKKNQFTIVCTINNVRIGSRGSYDNVITHIKANHSWYELIDEYIIDIDDYIKKLQNIVGETITFHTREKKPQLIEDFYLAKIKLDKKNIMIYFIDVSGEKRSVDIYKPIIKYRKKIERPDVDPYGEEDWDDIDESIEYQDDTYYIGRRIEYMPMNKKYHDIFGTIVNVWKDFNGDIAIRIKFDKDWTSGLDNKCYSFSVPNKTIKLMDENRKIRKIKNTELDPYGEEDWGYEEIIDESLNNDDNKELKVGYRIEYKFSYGDDESKYGKNKLGTVIRIENNYATIQFDERWSPSLEYDNTWSFKYPSDYWPKNNIMIISDEHKKFRKIKNTELDPYEEDDWGYEIQESNDFGFEVNLNKLSKKYLGENHKFDIRYKKELERLLLNKLIKFETWTRTWINGIPHNPSRVIITDEIKKIEVSTSGTILVTISNGESYNLLYNDNSIHVFDPEYDKKTAEKRLKYKDVDPYDEEDWGDMDMYENNKFEFKLDLNKIVKEYANNYIKYEIELKRLLINNIVKFITHKSGGGYITITDKIINVDVNYDVASVIVTIPNKERYNLLYIPDSVSIMGDEELYKKIEKEREEQRLKKEEQRLKYLDIDPYGEDDWDMNESYNNKIRYTVLDSINLKNANILELNLHFTGWISFEDELNDYIMNISKWNNIKSFRYESYYFNNQLNLRCGSYLLSNQNIVIHKLDVTGIDYNRKITEEDPYGEEDWNE